MDPQGNVCNKWRKTFSRRHNARRHEKLCRVELSTASVFGNCGKKRLRVDNTQRRTQAPTTGSNTLHLKLPKCTGSVTTKQQDVQGDPPLQSNTPSNNTEFYYTSYCPETGCPIEPVTSPYAYEAAEQRLGAYIRKMFPKVSSVGVVDPFLHQPMEHNQNKAH